MDMLLRRYISSHFRIHELGYSVCWVVSLHSFSDGGAFHDSVEGAAQRALQLVDDGADIIDIGGESTRPGAECVDVQVEAERVVPVIR